MLWCSSITCIKNIKSGLSLLENSRKVWNFCLFSCLWSKERLSLTKRNPRSEVRHGGAGVMIRASCLTFFIRTELFLAPIRVASIHVGANAEHINAQVEDLKLSEVTWPFRCPWTRRVPPRVPPPQLVNPGMRCEKNKKHKTSYSSLFETKPESVLVPLLCFYMENYEEGGTQLFDQSGGFSVILRRRLTRYIVQWRWPGLLQQSSGPGPSPRPECSWCWRWSCWGCWEESALLHLQQKQPIRDQEKLDIQMSQQLEL